MFHQRFPQEPFTHSKMMLIYVVNKPWLFISMLNYIQSDLANSIIYVLKIKINEDIYIFNSELNHHA